MTSKDFRDRFESANQLHAEGKLPQAEAAFRELLATQASSPAILCRLGDINRRLGDAKQAESYFQRAIEVRPEFVWSYIGLAQLVETTDIARALELYKKAVALGAKSPAANSAINTLQAQLTALHDKQAFEQRFKHANRLCDKGQYAQAQPIYRELLDRDPQSVSLQCKLASTLYQQGLVEEAAQLYEKAAALDPSFIWVHVGRSDIAIARGMLGEALAALEHVLKLNPTLEFAKRRIGVLREQIREATANQQAPDVKRWPRHDTSESTVSLLKPSRARIGIIAWDLTHNPLGRAWVLAELVASFADCELIGPLFERYGTDLWEPLREMARRFSIRGFAAHDFQSFMNGAIKLVSEQPYDVVWVSKPRLPSLMIGFLYKLIHGSQVICDVDDDELAFVKADAPLSLQAFIADIQPADWREPFAKRWTQLAQTMLTWADAITTCNPVLQEQHGGIVIRHARDEAVFDPARFDRDAIRSEFGFAPSDRVVLFLGTPRRHKGIISLAEALAEIADPSVVLCIIGTIADSGLKAELGRIRSLRIQCHPDMPFSRVPELNAMADLVCLLQDDANPISKSQTPAKLTDALAMGTAIVATPTAPIADLAGPGLIHLTDGADLVATLRAALSERGPDAAATSQRRAFFLRELSYAANAERARHVIEASRFSRSAAPDDFLHLLRFIEQWMPAQLDHTLAAHLPDAARLGLSVAQKVSGDKPINLVFFWKQNDSDLLGRRQDMLTEQLRRSPRIKRILHIDAPICIDQIEEGVSARASRDGSRLITANTIARFLRAHDDDRVHRRSFVYRGRSSSFLGRDLPAKESFPNFVDGWIRELDLSDNTVAWVCPVVPMFPQVQARIGFPFVISDVIDDQRQWPMTAERRRHIEQNYRETFAVTDVAVANCQPVANWLEQEGLSPLLVPNGMELHDDVDGWGVPSQLAALPRPIVGYAGNLRDRIDWPLIAAVAEARPDWSIVLIGSVPQNGLVEDVAAYPNVHMLGTVPYRQALRYIAAFDIAIVPHMQNELSERMNPLKLYVYRSVGIPVVSTSVANIDDFADDIRISATPEDFLVNLDLAIADRARNGRTYPDRDRMLALSWESRLAAILSHVDQALLRRKMPDNLEAAS